MNAKKPVSSRRHFLHTAAAGAVLGPYALTLAPSAHAAQPPAGAWPDFAKGEVLRTRAGGGTHRREDPVD